MNTKLLFITVLNVLSKEYECMDTWDIPYERRAVPMVGGSVTAPLGQCSNNFDTEDDSECVSVEHDSRSGNILLRLISSANQPLHCTVTGSVNVTLNCCVYNDRMFKKDTMISANAYRCEVLVCEEKV